MNNIKQLDELNNITRLTEHIKGMKEESEEELKKNDTNYEEVINNKDTDSWGEDGENNNFSAGRISACKEILSEINRDIIKRAFDENSWTNQCRRKETEEQSK